MSHRRAILVIVASAVLLAGRSTQAATLQLAWDANVDGVTSGYVVSYGTSSRTYLQQVDAGFVTTLAVDDLVDGTTYYFVVQAYNDFGERSLISAELRATAPGVSPVGVPAPPSSLVATLRDGHFIDLQWHAAVVGTPTYRVDVGTAPGLSNVSSLSAGTATTATVGSLPTGTYYIRVRSVTAAGVSTATNEVVVSCADVAPGTPATPTNLVATLRDGNFIDLTWHGPATGASGYRVEVGIAPGGTFSSFTTGVTTTFTISDLVPGRYYLRVRSVNGSVTSAPSNEVVVSATPQVNAPRNMSAVILSGRVIRLDWQPPADASGVVGYLLEAGTGPGRSDLASIPVDGLSFTSPVVPSGTYFLRVRARQTSGVGSPSAEVGVQVGVSIACTTPPGVPHLVADAVGTLVQLSWSAGAGDNPTGYVLDVGSSPGKRDIAILQFGADTTSLSAPAANGTYALRLSAVNACGAAHSVDTAVAVGGPAPTAPGSPIELTRHVAGKVVTLTWSQPITGGEGTGYVIEATTTDGQPIVTLDTGNLATAFVHGDVPPGTYVVRVRSANAAGVGAPSNAVTVVVTP